MTHRLIATPTADFSPDKLRELLKNSPLVRHVIPFAQIGSTNTWAMQQSRRTPRQAAGLLVTTEHQTEGRGRLNHQWTETPGSSLLFSLVTFTPIKPMRIMLGMPLAVAAALNAFLPADLQATLKWPNDVMVCGDKICGILMEHPALPDGMSSLVVVGVGLNVFQTKRGGSSPHTFPPSLRYNATSLLDLMPNGGFPSREEILASIVNELGETMSQPIDDIVKAYNDKCDTIGRLITLADGRSGKALYVNDDGALVLQPNDRTQPLISVHGGEIGYWQQNK